MFEKTINKKISTLAESLGESGVIKDFYLAGGTALSLRLGHRKSRDLDFFSQKNFNLTLLSDFLVSKLNAKIIIAETGTLLAEINGVKSSFFHYPYKNLEETESWRSIALASLIDISCMKIIAISQRAEKKDFFDFYEIIKLFSSEKLKAALLEKYGRKSLNCYHILKSLFYFEDAESSPDPVSINGTKWKDVKAKIKELEKQLNNSFLKC
ncbi:MAG: nucleotidyl transferase AbiEii/AbiGii toxin family protein [Victivallales bacterium]|jgi:predicted nucleotidyltransferase component of viral defense system